jgi:hypothetical protein
LFNVNETGSQSVLLDLPGRTVSSSVTIDTYSKAIYDLSRNNVWAPPTNTDLGPRKLPLALTLAPWSMNVVLIQ